MEEGVHGVRSHKVQIGHCVPLKRGALSNYIAGHSLLQVPLLQPHSELGFVCGTGDGGELRSLPPARRPER